MICSSETIFPQIALAAGSGVSDAFKQSLSVHIRSDFHNLWLQSSELHHQPLTTRSYHRDIENGIKPLEVELTVIMSNNEEVLNF